MDLFNLKAILKLDDSEYKSGLSTAASIAGKAGSAIGKGLATAAKVGTAALTATTTAVTAVGTAAIKSYANYEQLAGGVEKLYATAADKVKAYADQAYATSGMSANQYMETATSFSAALIKSLGNDYDKAADMTDVAMQAISDNVNVFGSDMASVQNAFQGFAKQNYTMLDNLKLGYGGTKEQMEQLIADANEWAATNGKAADLSIDSFADVVTAIDYIQQKQGIAGATAMEAMKTLEGSANMTKAAWQNVITAIGRGEGLSEAIDGLIKAVFGEDEETGLLNQIVPRVQTVMEGIGKFVSAAGPFISDRLPDLVNSILPNLISAGMDLLSALGQGFMDYLPDLLFTVGDIMEQILQTLVDATANGSGYILEVIDWILGVFEENYTDFIDMGFEIITNILDGFISGETDIISYASIIIEHFVQALIEYAPYLLEAATNAIVTLATGLANELPTLIPIAIEAILTIVESLLDNVDQLVDAAIEIILALANGLIDALPRLIEKAPVIIEKLVNAIINNLPKLLEAGAQIIASLIESLLKNLPQILKAAVEIIGTLVSGLIGELGAVLDAGVRVIDTIWNGIKEGIGDAANWGRDLIDSFVDGIKGAIGGVVDAVRGIADTVSDYLHFSEPDVGPLANFHTFAPDMMGLFIKGIKDNTGKLQDQIESSFDFEDLINANADISIGAGATAGTSNNSVVVNVYAAEGQDVNELAEIVSRRIAYETRKQGMTWGTT